MLVPHNHFKTSETCCGADGGGGKNCSPWSEKTQRQARIRPKSITGVELLIEYMKYSNSFGFNNS